MQNNPDSYPTIVLQKGKEEAVKRFHPWIFSGAIKTKPLGIKTGAIVTVCDFQDKVLGTGFYEGEMIEVKLLSFNSKIIDKAFFEEKLFDALRLRQQLGLIDNPEIQAYRLVHSEGDGLPGLIIDIYGKTAVLQAQSTGMYHQKQVICNALLKVMQGRLEAVFDKSAEALGRMNKDAETNDYLFGAASENTVTENGLSFSVDWEKGQKTGFFIDQRDNRQLLRSLSKDKRVLNTFSYSGGFSVYALAGGATAVVSVDSSKRAIELCDKNILLNGFQATQYQSVCQDAKKYLEQLQGNDFDIIVLDPPAFAKNHSSRHKGLQGYKYINYEAIKKIDHGGLLFTFSCSQAVDRSSFQSIVMAAAIEAQRPVRILHYHSQSADHPVSIFHPEGAYLKGLLLQIE
ncbi:MAG: RlmI/RlmK family 23S rRNA methyltransferase [Bacteroidetes bacterium HGW-Bacteroidetes-1]|jgi:23S rRNA (cytosine1962-C5)-methyltransferase|nr:MAG: RlmI/RlmK family 23S rRNA methyltransferase [Bacteroidetes bacterium HGW-Bacteroidetes-1]